MLLRLGFELENTDIDSLQGQDFSVPQNYQFLGLTQRPIQRVPGDSSETRSGRGMKLTTHNFHLAPRLRMRGPMHLLPLYTFMASTGVTITPPPM